VKKKKEEKWEDIQMVRTRTPRGWKETPHHSKYPAGRFGEEGAPGWMLAPEGCPKKKHNFKRIGSCVDLAICGYYCEDQCEKYLMFRKNARVRVKR